jgi:hypothetical protein
MAEEARSTEVQVALYVGEAIGSSLIGGAATELITDPVLSFVGIKSSDPTVTLYLKQISEKLSALGQSLDDQMRNLQGSFDRITSISTEIKEHQSHYALAQILGDYSHYANTIESAFGLFVDDVLAAKDAVASTSLDAENNPITDLQKNVLNHQNAERVSEAMSGIHHMLVKPSEFNKSIFDHLRETIGTEIEDYAENDENYRHSFELSHETSQQLPRNFQYYDCGKIVVQGHVLARAALPGIAGLFRNIVTTQMRGLIFLAKAWEKSPHARTLGLRTSEVIEEINLMKAFYPAYKASVEKTIAESLKKNGKYFTDDMLHAGLGYANIAEVWKDEKHTLKDLTVNGVGRPLDRDWIMMRILEAETVKVWTPNQQGTKDLREPRDYLYLVYQPWTEASKLPAGANRYFLPSGRLMPPNFPQRRSYNELEFPDLRYFDPSNLDAFFYPGLKPLSTDLPEELATVLNGLPSSLDDIWGPRLWEMIQKSSVPRTGLALSFKCEVSGQDSMWLQGNADGSLSLTPTRSADGSASAAWRTFITQTGDVREKLQAMVIKCLGLDSQRSYLNYEPATNVIELADSSALDASRTGWFIVPRSGNTVWLARRSLAPLTAVERPKDLWKETDDLDERIRKEREWVDRREKDFKAHELLEGHADGSISLSQQGDSPSLLWKVYPYVVDS